MQKPRHKLYPTAENCFVEQGMTCAAISELTGITETTLSKWRNTYNWDTLRDEALASPGKIRQLLLDEIKNLSEGGKATIDTDGLSKVAKALQYFDGKVSLAVVISVLKEFDNWMAGNDPQTAVRFLEYHRQFINYRAQADSLK